MDPQWIIAACTAVGAMITWTSTMIGAAIWIVSKINKVKTEILTDINAKHNENRIRVDAMQTLLIRHETILDPEFNGTGRHRSARQ